MLSDFNWIEATARSPIFLALVGFSIVTLGIALERVYYFWKRNGDADKIAQNLIDKVQRGQADQAVLVCERTAHPIGAVVSQLLSSVDHSLESIEEHLHVALSQQKLLLERNLNVLGTMAAIAPLVGLLGTVWGIMRAFSDMAQVGSAAPSVVAAGVAEALVTTAAGLVVAVPALMLYNHFTRRLNVMLTVAENHARRIRSAMTGGGHNTPASDHTSTKKTKAPEKTPEVAPVA